MYVTHDSGGRIFSFEGAMPKNDNVRKFKKYRIADSSNELHELSRRLSVKFDHREQYLSWELHGC